MIRSEDVAASFAEAAKIGDGTTPDGVQLCHLPAEVPSINANFQAAPDVQRLKSLLMAVSDGTQGGGGGGSNMLAVSSASKSTVGAHGMGGIGKTVSRPFPSWNRSILTEIYLCHACSCQEILRMEMTGQGARDGDA